MKFIKFENVLVGSNTTKTSEIYINKGHIKAVNNYDGNAVVTYGSGECDYFISYKTVEEMLEFIEQHY